MEITTKEFQKLEKIYGGHVEGCQCNICLDVQEYYDTHRTDCMPELTREMKFNN